MASFPGIPAGTPGGNPDPSPTNPTGSYRGRGRGRGGMLGETVTRRRQSRRRVTDVVEQARELPMEQSKIYTSLLDFERNLDHAISRRRKSILSAILKPQPLPSRRSVLRVWVYNINHNQPLRDPEQRAALPKGRKRLKMEEDALAIDKPTTGIPPTSMPVAPAAESSSAPDTNTAATSNPDPDASSDSEPAPTIASSSTQAEPKPPPERAEDEEVPSWTLRVQGKLVSIGEPNQEMTRQRKQTLNGPHGRFSSLIERAVVQLDSNMYTDHNLIEWMSSDYDDPLPGEMDKREHEILDGFELKRAGSGQCRIQILLYPRCNRFNFKILSPLSEILDVTRCTRSHLLTLLWTYITEHGLMDNRTGNIINNNADLKKVFNCNQMNISELTQRINEYLAPLDPVQIIHELDLNDDNNGQCYDISLDHPDPQQYSSQAANALPNLKEAAISVLNAEIEKNMRRIETHVHKRDFLLAFSHSPIDVMTSLITSQAREAVESNLMTNADVKASEDKLYYQTYFQPWIHEAVLKYLNDCLKESFKEREEDSQTA